MQICQHCARPTADPACTCHHPTDTTESGIRSELFELDASLAPPPSPEPAETPAPIRDIASALTSATHAARPTAPSATVNLPPEAATVTSPAPRAVTLPPGTESVISATVASDGAPQPRPPAAGWESRAATAGEDSSAATAQTHGAPSGRHSAEGAAAPRRVTSAQVAAKPAPSSRVRPVAVVAAVFVAGGIGLIVARPSLRPDASVVNAATNPVEAPAAGRPAVPPKEPIEPTGPPKWVRSVKGWATDGSRIVGLELPAENDVRVWMKHVRPALAVRCLAGHVEAFVVTESATSIESVPDQHTVHVSFDGQKESEERWTDSESKHELFAPDGAAVAERLSRSRTMRFGFTPYSAQPVVAEFDVHGFEPPACGSAKGTVASRVAHHHGR